MWWVGENSNAAALEYAGDSEAVKATAAVNAAMLRRCSPGEIIAMQVSATAHVNGACVHMHRNGNEEGFGEADLHRSTSEEHACPEGGGGGLGKIMKDKG